MKKFFVLFIFIFLLIPLSVNAESERLVPLYVSNYNIQDTVSDQALFPIYRKIDGNTPISNTIRELLSVEFSKEERELGFSSEWNKNHSVTLKGVSLNKKEGKLIIELRDPYRFTSGGSARVITLKNQITQTVLQFKVVEHVEFIGPNYLFQP